MAPGVVPYSPWGQREQIVSFAAPTTALYLPTGQSIQSALAAAMFHCPYFPPAHCESQAINGSVDDLPTAQAMHAVAPAEPERIEWSNGRDVTRCYTVLHGEEGYL